MWEISFFVFRYTKIEDHEAPQDVPESFTLLYSNRCLTYCLLSAQAGLFDYKNFLLERVVRPLMVIQRHNEAVFATFYNEIIPLALQTTSPDAMAAHASVLASID